MRAYFCPFGMTAVTVAADLIEATPADDRLITVLRCNLGQTTELGDAAEEFIATTFIRGHTTSGSGGVAAAAGNSADPSDVASGFTYEALNTTAASVGTTKILAQLVWSVRGGLDLIFLPEEHFWTTQGNTTLVWRMGAAPADSITLGGCVSIGEVG